MNKELRIGSEEPKQPTVQPDGYKKSSLIFFVIFIAIVLLVSISLFLLSKNRLLPVPLNTSSLRYSQYKTQMFSVSYPADWTLEEGGFYEGFGISVRPGILRDPSVYVAEYKNFEKLALAEQLNSEYKYKKSTIMLKDGEAIVWAGSRRVTLSGAQIQEKEVILVRPDRFYKLSLMYNAKQMNEVMKRFLAKLSQPLNCMSKQDVSFAI